MDRFDQYRVFVQVAEMGGFTRAAHALGLPRASVSAAVQQLEAQLGARLLHRTTRRVRLTADGEQLLERLRPLLAESEEIDRLFAGSDTQVAGRLRIEVPSRIARRLIAPALPSLLRRHPHLQVELGSSDRIVDLVREGVDGAVRVGALQDSSLVVRPIGHLALINCASPAYLREHGTPRHPDALREGHWAVGYACPRTGRAQPWEYQDASDTLHMQEVPSRVIVSNAETYIAACRAGLGLIQVPRFDVRHLLERGELTEVMPAHRAASMPISFLYPHRRLRPDRLAVFLDWFETLIRPHLDE